MQMKDIIDMAADRGNIFAKVKVLICGWKTQLIRPYFHALLWLEKGLKTGIYYLRRKPKHQPQQFTIKPKNEATMKL